MGQVAVSDCPSRALTPILYLVPRRGLGAQFQHSRSLRISCLKISNKKFLTIQEFGKVYHPGGVASNLEMNRPQFSRH